MLGVLYLLFAWWVGYCIIKKFLPQLFNMHTSVTLYGSTAPLQSWLVTLPASFLTGTLFTTWITYLSALLFCRNRNPLLYGNIISILIITLVITFLSYQKSSVDSYAGQDHFSISRLKAFLKENLLEILFTLVLVCIYSSLTFYTFYIQKGTMYVGHMIWGDFGAHLDLIRSFSFGANFPTQYPHFANGDIRYHFLFHFLVGNLEYLKLRIDWAFNLPCILSSVSFLMLLFSLAVLMMGKKSIGITTVILFFFRSSPAIFKFIADIPHARQILPKMLANTDLIGYTPYEDWGIWAQGVYQNQRHLAFSLGILILVIILVWPLFKKMLTALQTVSGENKNARNWWKEFLISEDAWLMEENARGRSIMAGLILGLTGFWNGMVVIAALVILFFLAVFSKHRLEFLIIAALTGILVIFQSMLFIGPGNALIQPKLVIGFLAAKNNLPGILQYYLKVFGILPLVLIGCLVIFPKGGRQLILAYTAPIILINFVQLTRYSVTGHKIALISILLLNIFVADFLCRLFTAEFKSVLLRKLTRTAIITVFILLTITGIFDWLTLFNINKYYVAYPIDTPAIDWIRNHTGPKAVFLTEMDIYVTPLLAGRMAYCGWPAFADSAGYNVGPRVEMVKKIYSNKSPREVRRLLRQTNIDYIYIDDGNRNSPDYKLNEKLFRNNFKLVYHEKAAPRATIYRAR